MRVCQFCNSKYDKRYRHAISCHAVTQTALARVRAHLLRQEQGEHGADSRAGGSTDAGGIWGSVEHSREEGADDTSGRGGLSARQAQQTQYGKGSAGRGTASNGWRANRSSRKMSARNSDNDDGQVDELVKLLCIRQEDTLKDTLNILKQSTSWVLFARTEAPSVIPGLVTASQKWKEEITKPNSQLNGISLRTALLWCLLNQVMEMLKAFTEDQMKKAKESGWCNEQGQWVYQKWSPINHVLEQDVARAPSASTNIGSDEIDRGPQGPDHGGPTKRPLTPNMQGAMVVFHLDVNFRKPEANP